MHNRARDFWHVMADELGGRPITPRARAVFERERSFAELRDRWTEATPAEQEKIAVLLVPWIRSVTEIEADLPEAPERDAVARANDVVTPAWWRTRVESLFRSLSDLQTEAMTILGITRSLEKVEVEDVLVAQLNRERRGGDSLRLYFPLRDGQSTFSHGSGNMWVYRGYYRDDSGWFWAKRLRELREHTDWFVDTIGRREMTKAKEEESARWMEAWKAGDPLDHPPANPSQPLSRIVEIQDRIAKRTGCTEQEATEYLLCGIIPELPMVRVQMPSDEFLVRAPDGSLPDRPIHFRVMSPSVPPSVLSGTYSRWLGPRGDGGRSPEVRSANPLIAADFVRAYRKRMATEGRSASWPEMWESFHKEHPDAYGSLKSFRQTVYRQLGPSRKSGQS